MNELVNGIIRPETREQLLAVVDRLRVQERIQGLVLAGTELSLTLRDVTERDIPFLNTTEIHVNAAVAELLS
jgi:aspartate racemase